jgi:hypothetical protein
VAQREFRINLKQLVIRPGEASAIIEVTDVLPERPEVDNGSKGAEPADVMTEPQRRYLFRLLAAQGVEGKAAEDHLKDYFRVKGLRDVSRQQASQYIDQLVRDQKDAGGGRP